MIRVGHIITVMVVLLILPGMVWGFNSETTRKTLQGIKGVNVTVDDINPEIEKDGLTRSQIQTDVELKLRTAGLNILTVEEALKTPGRPWIYVNANIQYFTRGKIFRGAYICNLDLKLMQNVYLERNSKLSVASTTWSADGYLGKTPDLDDIRSKIKDLVDEFISAWLSVNPK
jgi:hypothetical protein